MSSSSGQQSIVQGSMFPSPRESDTLADTKRGSAPASPGKNTTTNGTAPTNTGESKYAARDGGVSSHYMRGCTVFLVRAAKTPTAQIGGVDVVDEVYVVPNHSTTHQSSRSCTPTEEDHDKCLETLRWNATTAMFGTCLQEEFEARLEDVMNYRVSEVPAEALHGVLRLGGVSILLIVTKLLSVAGGIQFPDFGEIYEVGGLSYVMLPTSGTPPNYNNNNGAPTPTLRPRGTPSHPAGRPSDADLKHYLTIVERYCSVSTHCGAKGLYISFNADISVPVAAHPGGKISSPLSSLLHHPDQQRSMESMGEIMLPESTNSLTSTPDGSSYPSTKTATKSALSSGSGGGGSRGSKYRNIFSWNANLCIGAFPDNRYTPPTMRGFVEGASVPCSGSGSDSAPIMVALFSRQSAKYAGTRYNRRGLSKDGIPANFVESEQLMWCGSFDKGGRPMPDEAGSYPSVSSYTVFRGSVPVDWSQRADLTSKPQTVVHDNPHVAFADHMRILDQLYPQHHIGCINLMTAKGIEAKLTDIFNTVAADYNADIAANVSDFGSNGTSTINNGRSTPQKCRSPMSKPTSAAVSPMLNANFGGGSGSNHHHHHHAPRLVSYLHYNLGDRLHDKKSFTEIQSEMIALLSEVILDNTKQPPTTTTTTTATVAPPVVSTAPMSYADVVGKKKAVSSLPASAASVSTEHHQQPKLPLLTVDSWKYRISKGSTNTPLALCKSPSFGSSSMRLVVDRRGHQHSIVRVNCLDCLDRTNVAQSMLATAVLEQQLEALGFEVADANAAATLSVVSDRIKTLWVNHGHRISMLYAGSNAHFSDIIRTGHATPKTFANPYPMAPIALRRFKLQNFYDGQKQDCISLVTGHHVPSPSRDPDQSTLHRPEVPNTIIKCSLLCVTALFFMLIFDHLYMNKGAFTTEICFGYASFMVMVGVMGRTAITRRKALVVNPLLR